jgi:hypothetical protein
MPKKAKKARKAKKAKNAKKCSRYSKFHEKKCHSIRNNFPPQVVRDSDLLDWQNLGS